MEPRFDRQTVRGHVRNVPLYITVLVGLVVSCILQLVGLATPGWLVIKTGVEPVSTTLNMGLWVIRICVMGQCTSVTEITETDQTRGVSTGMLQYQAETCVALVALVIAIVLFCCIRCEPCNRPGNIKTTVNALVVLTLISSILVVIAAGQFGIEVILAYDREKKNTFGESPIKVPYSLFLSGFGGILAVVTAMVIECTPRHWNPDAALSPYYEMPAPGAAGLYPGQQHHHAHPSYFEMPAPVAAGVPQPGYAFHGQAATPYAGQPPYGRNTDLIL